MDRKYNFIAKTFTSGTEVPVDEKCNSFAAINTGDTFAFVCGIPLLPHPLGHPELSGAAVSINGNENEIFSGRIWIVFDALPGLNPQIVIIQKSYL
jgi:hypothetical protein